MAENEPTLYDRVIAMAEELKLDGDERLQYIDQHMTKAGWTRNATYDPPESGNGSGGNKKSGGWFADQR
jgi:hypothetical protein